MEYFILSAGEKHFLRAPYNRKSPLSLKFWYWELLCYPLRLLFPNRKVAIPKQNPSPTFLNWDLLDRIYSIASDKYQIEIITL